MSVDYIQSVLTRQRQLLSLLLLGGEREAAEDAASAETVRAWTAGDGTNPASTVGGAGASRASGALPAQGAPASDGYPAAWGAALFSGGRAVEFPGGALSGGTAAAGAVPGGQAPVGEAAAYGGDTAARESRPVSYVLPSAAAVPGRAGAGVWDTAAAGTGADVSARALSRAFERDARRYDGGFSLY